MLKALLRGRGRMGGRPVGGVAGGVIGWGFPVYLLALSVTQATGSALLDLGQ